MTNNFPKMWQNIKMIKTRISGEKEEYSSRIIDIEQDGEIFIIETPLKKMQLVMLMNGSKLNMIYMLENLGVLSCDIEVVDKLKENGIPLIRVKRVSNIKKIQRRNFFRLETALDVTIRKIDDIIVEKVKTIDISGGGMRIISNQKFEINDIVKINFNINNKEYEFDSKVVKTNEDKDRKEVSLQFIEILEKDRNEIIKYIFDKQREGIKKGTISNE